MKILLDENIPYKLKKEFDPAFEVSHLKDIGWLGKKNGELMNLANLKGFHIFITMDKNLKNQQNLSKFSISVFVLIGNNNRFKTVRLLLQKAIERIKNENYPALVEITL